MCRIDLAALLALGVVDGDAPLPAFDEHHEPGHGYRHGKQRQDRHDVHFTGARQFQRGADGMRQTGDDTAEDDHGDAVADSAFSHLLAQPHQENRARHQRDDRGDDEPRPRIHYQGATPDMLPLQGGGDAEGLQHGQPHRAIAGVLGDLVPSRLAAFLLQLLE